MKRDKIIYWTSTGIVSFVMLFSVINFTFFDTFVYPEGAFQHIGLPSYFRVELTVAKVLGLIALLFPGTPRKIREFAYFGFAITLFSASVAHYSVGDGVFYVIDPLLFLCALIVSYVYDNKINRSVAAKTA